MVSNEQTMIDEIDLTELRMRNSNWSFDVFVQQILEASYIIDPSAYSLIDEDFLLLLLYVIRNNYDIFNDNCISLDELFKMEVIDFDERKQITKELYKSHSRTIIRSFKCDNRVITGNDCIYLAFEDIKKYLTSRTAKYNVSAAIEIHKKWMSYIHRNIDNPYYMEELKLLVTRRFKALMKHYSEGATIVDFINSNDNVAISGSTVLGLITNVSYRNSDIDIYVHIDPYDDDKSIKEKIERVRLLIVTLDSAGYRFDRFHDFAAKYGSINLTRNTLRKSLGFYYNKNIPKEYRSLSKYILSVHTGTLDDLRGIKKVQVIMTTENIHTIISNTFDFDIVKNYYTRNTLYINNLEAIHSKCASMDLKHFKHRTIRTMNEFRNFNLRYDKYSDRGFKIYIGGVLITKNFVTKLNTKRKGLIDPHTYYSQHKKVAGLVYSYFRLMRWLLLTAYRRRLLKFIEYTMKPHFANPDHPSMIYKFKHKVSFGEPSTRTYENEYEINEELFNDNRYLKILGEEKILYIKKTK